MDRDEVIAEIKRVASLLGRDRVSVSEFRRHGKVGTDLVAARFGTWNKALEAAGLVPIEEFKRIDDGDLEEEFRRVHAKLGKVPTYNEFRLESRFSPATYKKRFGGWRNALTHYLGADEPQPGRQSEDDAEQSFARPVSDGRTLWAPSSGKAGRVFGPPLNFRGLRHEPVNEQGVVLLFGMVAQELGFLVEAAGTGFPDCRAKRGAKGGYYLEVDIEFEFRSSNFLGHGHDPQKCNLIVCWVHDWLECPIEVLELKSAIKQLKSDV